MRIVIDMQGAQSGGSRNRGIGRYTTALCKAMIASRGEHEVILAFNGLFHETLDAVRGEFAGLVPDANMAVWEATFPTLAIDPAHEARRKMAELTREAFLASLNPDIVLVTSLFEGLVDNAVTSIGTFASLPTAVVLYDLVPLIHQKQYLQNPPVARWYLNKVDQVRRADLLLSISESSGGEARDYLGFPQSKVVNISTACDSRFRPQPTSQGDKARIAATYGLDRPFLMYTGGIDLRKNIESLIAAFAELPKAMRARHQLAIVCAAAPADQERLLGLARSCGLNAGEVVMTGFVPDEDLTILYNACKLFIFPSWHEGFGLPALEAMACGRAVIGSDRSSIPEVIGRSDALFDPFDQTAITAKIAEILGDDAFRAELERHSLVQAKRFSWEQTAQTAWRALEDMAAGLAADPADSVSREAVPIRAARRPRLAYFSPLPPAKTGIGDYSAELLPELSRHYEIEVIVTQTEVGDAWITTNCPVRDVGWFRAHADSFDRIMYHFGNSPFHGHMFELLDAHPGVVVLHDFFLSHIRSYLDATHVTQSGWERSHLPYGWKAIKQVMEATNEKDRYAFPCNLDVLQQATGVIFHSDYSLALAEEQTGVNHPREWAMVPLLRQPAVHVDRHASRQRLGVDDGTFIVCSFGHLGRSKMNDRLLSAWLASPMASDPSCRLVFVGESSADTYVTDLLRSIRRTPTSSNIEITGWLDSEDYRHWLATADVGVQLRTMSRGETSAAVLDCMNYGMATVVNANGAMAGLPADAVWMLPDEFSNEALTEAMTELWRNKARRTELGTRGREVVATQHAPRHCADLYKAEIERFYAQKETGLHSLMDAAALVTPPPHDGDWHQLSVALAHNFPPSPRRRQLLLDVSILAQHDARSGIQRVVRSLLLEYLLNPPEGWDVQPVLARPDTAGFLYARRFTCRFLGLPEWAEDEPADAWPGDVFLGLDLQHAVLPMQQDFLKIWRHRGVKLHFVIYDLLPLLLPDLFPDGSPAMHQRWLETISVFDGAICISRAVADEYYDWVRTFAAPRGRPLAINWFHLGADIDNSMPTRGLPADAGRVLQSLAQRKSFLTVGTIEPRKGQVQLLDAFERLWSEGLDFNLVIVGKQGWKMEDFIARLQHHDELGVRLFWLDSASDEYLDQVYAACVCLIAPSQGEGFGLPLIEAARHGLPILARDIPVFREVAGDHATYFTDDRSPDTLAVAVRRWTVAFDRGTAPRSDDMPSQTWREAAADVFALATGKETPYKTWLPDGAVRFWGSDPRLSTAVGERLGRSILATGTGGMLIYGPYMDLASGNYILEIDGRGVQTGEAWADSVCERGENQLFHRVLPSPAADNSWSVRAEFMLNKAVTDFEVRVWVPYSADLSVDLLTIRRVVSEAAPEPVIEKPIPKARAKTRG